MRDPNGKPQFAKRSLGQNFLTDVNYIRKIIDALDPRPEDTIVEIGPGRGALTEHLVESGAAVIAIELDRDLSRMLINRFGNGRFQLLETNVLNLDFRSLWFSQPANAGGAYRKLVANLPYYISTAILQRLAAQREVFSEMVLMFQKDVVDRICAEPGNSDRGFLTVIAEASFEIQKLFNVPPTAFSPRPKVWSSVVRLIPKPKSDLDDEVFVSLVSEAFGQKRKTIFNNLKRTYPDAARRIGLSGIDPKRRAETISLDEWEALFRSFVRSQTTNKRPLC